MVTHSPCPLPVVQQKLLLMTVSRLVLPLSVEGILDPKGPIPDFPERNFKVLDFLPALDTAGQKQEGEGELPRLPGVACQTANHVDLNCRRVRVQRSHR